MSGNGTGNGKSLSAARLAVAVASGVLCLTAGAFAAGCSSTADAGSASMSYTLTAEQESNDTIVIGDLPRVSDVESEEEEGYENGESLGFDEESQLQQEKTAGFSGGSVVSVNVQPLEDGITAGTEGDVPGFTASTGLPPSVPHSIEGLTTCLGCHSEGDNAVPTNHTKNSLGDETCLNCHTTSDVSE